MLPIDALMREHRIIERMIAPFQKEAARLEQSNRVNGKFIETAVDFLRVYADRNHHGKEEGILFHALSLKPLSNEHAELIKTLIWEHVQSRRFISSLEQAGISYANGNAESWNQVSGTLKGLAELYIMHIEKEDKNFFYPSMEYFSPQEREAILSEFWEFDRKLIHEKYERVVVELEKIASSE
jgi:hemerythrin-like domain-containing protein